MFVWREEEQLLATRDLLGSYQAFKLGGQARYCCALLIAERKPHIQPAVSTESNCGSLLVQLNQASVVTCEHSW